MAFTWSAKGALSPQKSEPESIYQTHERNPKEMRFT
jgi:hypothetical protein